ncbi:replication protein [Niallia taxi]|uniref:replication protein n=1 Tax=Niallia taxi TaxID=2499688 RepID=UPI0015F4A88D|nr:replication protein [Niallia taxi]
MLSNARPLNRARYHAWFHHKDSDGFITLAKKSKNGKWREYNYKPEALADHLSEWIGEDVYFSQNTFYKPSRKIENIRQLRSFYVDIDFYLLNYDNDWVLEELQGKYFGKIMPEPNLIIFSGRGIVLIWFIEPVPMGALPLWQSVQNYFVKTLNKIGSDAKASDAARVFRIDGSVNSKSGEEVRVDYLHDMKYVLREIQETYLPALTEKKVKTVKKKAGRPKKVVELRNTYTLHLARYLDLIKLVELREFDVKGYREIILFLYRYWQCCYLADAEQALQETIEFNNSFLEPLSENEVVSATKSAESAWEARNNKEADQIAKEKGYPGAGYNLTNAKIIKWLKITNDEMTHLQTIISSAEKRRRKQIRDRAYQENKRRERGDLTREEYLKIQHDKTDDMVFKLQELMDKHPHAKKTELAKMLGVSRQHFYRLVKQIEV